MLFFQTALILSCVLFLKYISEVAQKERITHLRICLKMISVIEKGTSVVKEIAEEYKLAAEKYEEVIEAQEKIIESYENIQIDSIGKNLSGGFPPIEQLVGAAIIMPNPQPLPKNIPMSEQYVFKIKDWKRSMLDILEKDLLKGTGCWLEIDRASLRPDGHGETIIDAYLVAESEQEINFARYIISNHIKNLMKICGGDRDEDKVAGNPEGQGI